MPQVSKYPASEDVYKKIFDVYLRTLTRLKTKRKLSYFLRVFLTPTEQVMLSKRLSIALLLIKGYKYSEISEVLKVSSNTISGVALKLKYNNQYRKIIDDLKKEEEVNEFLTNFGEKVAKLLAAGRSKSGIWIELERKLRKKRLEKGF